MNDKDLILKTMVSNPNRNPDTFFTPESLSTVVLKDKNTDEIEFLIREIIREKPELIKIEKVIGLPFAISPSGLVESFLKKGGFTKIEQDLEDARIKKAEREAKADKLMDLDLKLKQFESKIGKKIIIAGFLIAFLSFLITVLTLEFWRTDDNKPKQAEKNEANKELRFSLYNPTEFELRDITVGLPDTVLTYQNLKKQTQTEWVKVKSAYHYGFVRFFDSDNRKYYIQPIDYVGETPFEKGHLKFIIKSIDSINQEFEFHYEYKNN